MIHDSSETSRTACADTQSMQEAVQQPPATACTSQPCPAASSPIGEGASASGGSSTLPSGRTRFQQANREALLTLGLYAAYFVWWYAFAYGLGSGDPANYTYVWGFPAWFFYSCIAGYPVLTLVLWLVVHFCFKDMPIDDATLPEVDEPADTHAAVERASGPVI